MILYTQLSLCTCLNYTAVAAEKKVSHTYWTDTRDKYGLRDSGCSFHSPYVSGPHTCRLTQHLHVVSHII
jgi:hypothetical protein